MADFKPEKYEDYIDLYGILLTLKREIKLFTFIFILISAVGFIKTKFSKPIWKATFQIVAADSSANSFNAEGRLQGLINKSNFNMSKDLQTEVKILKSPVILMPAFNRYKSNFPQETNNLKYKDWVSNIEVELEPGTTVLQASFINVNKDVLIPALNEISQEYQNYSKRDQKRRFESTLKYLNNQINYYQKKSKLSLEKAQTYAIDFYLTPLTGKSDIDKEIQSSFFFK